MVTGSSTCLLPEQAEALGITVVPMRLSVEGHDLRDLVDIRPADVYQLLRAGVELHSAAPTPGDWLAAFEAAEGPVLCLTEGSSISAATQAARLAAEMTSRGPVEVVDTGTAAGGLRLLALAAARAAAEGARLEGLAEWVRQLCSRVEMAGMLETTEYLGRSGRIPEVASWGGSILKVRPVVRFRQGKGRLSALVRSPSRGLRHLAGLAVRAAERQEAGPQGRGFVCSVFHGDAPQLAASLLEELRHRLPEASLELSEMTPAMGAHTGPGVVGLAYYAEPEPLRPLTPGSRTRHRL